MPAYKDDKQNSWYCQFYYEDWQGNKKKKKKRGFKTKKEAQEWENSFKVSANANMDMTLARVLCLHGEKPMMRMKALYQPEDAAIMKVMKLRKLPG